jgi:hypothetical protein
MHFAQFLVGIFQMYQSLVRPTIFFFLSVLLVQPGNFSITMVGGIGNSRVMSYPLLPVGCTGKQKN